MNQTIDVDAWVRAMTARVRESIALICGLMDQADPAAADDWSVNDHRIDFSDPLRPVATLEMMRPNAKGRITPEGCHYLTYDHLKSLARGPTAHLTDAEIGRAVTRQFVDRRRDAETTRLSPDSAHLGWACDVDVLTAAIVSACHGQTDLGALAGQVPDAERFGVSSTSWPDDGSTGPRLFVCYLAHRSGSIDTDGLEVRFGADASRRLRVESHQKTSGPEIHLLLHGVHVPETEIMKLLDRPLSRLLDDPSIAWATALLRVKSIENVTTKAGGPGLAVVTDQQRVWAAAPPEGAVFSWIDVRNPLAPLHARKRILPYSTIPG